MDRHLVADALDLAAAPVSLRMMVEACAGSTTHDFGDELTVEGQRTESLRVIVTGRARGTVRGPDGAEIQAGSFGPGAVLGAESAFELPAAVTVRASGPLETITLHASVVGAAAGLWEPTTTALRRALHTGPGSHRRDRTEAAAPPETTTTLTREVLSAGETAPSTADPDWSAFRSRRRRRVPLVFGIDEMDCGPAALTAVCRSFGHPVSFSAVREAVSTAADGTSLLGLYRGALALGLRAQMTTVSTSRLDDLPLPAICHVDGNHWVVVEHIGRRRITVMDPMGAATSVDRADFEASFSGFALLLAPTDQLSTAPRASSGGALFKPLLRREWLVLTLAVLAGAAIAAANLAIPLSSGWVVREVIQPKDTGSLPVVLALVLGVLGLAAVLTFGQRYLITRAALRIDAAALDQVAGTLLGLPTSFFHTRRTGDIERRLNALREVRSFFLTRGVAALVAAFQVVGAMVIIARWDVRLLVVYAVVAPLYLVLMFVASRKLRPAFRSMEESWGRYKSRQIDAIRGIDTVKAGGAEAQLRGRLAREFDDLRDRLFTADLTIMLYQGALGVLALLPLALALWIGSYSVVDGRLEIGDFVSFISIVMVTSTPMTLLFSTWDVVQQTKVLLERLGEIEDTPPEQAEGHGVPVGRLTGTVVIDQVTFWHSGAAQTPVLREVSAAADPGQTIAIVGRSGAGKSTLLHLIAGLVQPSSGRITCDGYDLADVELRSYRRQLGVVLQDSHLFDGTIAENIAFGEDHIDLDRVARAALTATADDFVRRMPFGYQTRVGERGIRLSGGERQRICVARALYRDPAVLLLDEATSALDAESEQALQASLRAALAGRTVFVVAHRLSTVRNADEILVLDAGRIVERGTHTDLVSRGGIYQELAANQLS